MALDIVWTDEANEGVDNIIDYLAEKWTEREIRNFFIRLEECLEKIAEAPQIHKDSLRKPGTKEFQHSKQTTIFYTYDSEMVYILRVWTNVNDPNSL